MNNTYCKFPFIGLQSTHKGNKLCCSANKTIQGINAKEFWDSDYLADVKNKMLTEINLTALVSVDKNFQKKEELERIILIKVPAEIYPTLYDTFVYLFTQAGVKNISITKEVDFEKLYNERKKV